MLSLAKPGDKVAMDVWRDGKIVRIGARLGDASEKAAPEERDGWRADSSAKLGLALRPLAPGEKRESGLAAAWWWKTPMAPPPTPGCMPGDVLLSINGRPVTASTRCATRSASPAKSVALLIQRGSDKIFIPVRIG